MNIIRVFKFCFLNIKDLKNKEIRFNKFYFHVVHADNKFNSKVSQAMDPFNCLHSLSYYSFSIYFYPHFLTLFLLVH